MTKVSKRCRLCGTEHNDEMCPKCNGVPADVVITESIWDSSKMVQALQSLFDRSLTSKCPFCGRWHDVKKE